jgi:hypothetical protein
MANPFVHIELNTNDVGKAMAAASALEFGGVHINDIPTFRADQQPYGGLRDAGNTREGPRYTVREMTELRVVSLPRQRGSEQAVAPRELHRPRCAASRWEATPCR